MTKFEMVEMASRRTPYYFYDLSLLGRTLQAAKSAAGDERYRIHYAIKANANPRIAEEVAKAGFGVDCVSAGEIDRALEAGFSASDIVFAGVGKTDEEIRKALEVGIGCFNVESEPELRVISEIATDMGKVAPVAIRVNPDIDAHTHEYITTGLAENKFGINLDKLEEMLELTRELPGVELKGLHFHIGSQITITKPFEILSERINKLQDEYEGKGYRFETINVGGGLGIDYDDPDGNPVPDFEGYFGTFRKHLKLRDGQTLHFELGRALVAQCGSLITRVLYVKKGSEKQFAIVDAGMTELIRPALYGAHHKIENISEPGNEEETYDVVGPICESSDCFGKDERLPRVERGSMLALRSAGAYGEIMASGYNCRALPVSYFG